MKNRPQGSVVVVEIGGDWLKIAQVGQAQGGAAPSKLHVEKIEAVDSSLSARIVEAFKKLQIPRGSVIACLPRQMVNVRMLELPSTDSQEIEDMVDLQSTKQTPYTQDEIVSDYRLAGEGRKGYTRIMLVIAQRGILRQRFFVLEEAGLDVERMSVSSEGILNWCRQAVPGRENVAVLDVDSSYSDLVAVSGGELALTKSILIGANQLLGEFDRWKDKLGREVQQALEALQTESGAAAPSRLIITGAGAAVKGLAEALGQHLALPIETRDPLQGGAAAKSGAAGPAAPPQPLSLTALIGMASAPADLGINRVPDSVRMRKNLVNRAHGMTGLGITLMAALFSVSLYSLSALYLRKADLAGLRREILREAPSVTRIEKQQELLKLIARREDWRFGALSVLANVHELEGNVRLEKLDFSDDKEKDQVVLEGSAQTWQDVTGERGLMPRLEQSAMFRDVKEGRTMPVDDNTKRSGFQVLCTLERSP